MFGTSLGDLPRLRPGVKRMRASSWDRSGGNDDRWRLEAGQARSIVDLEGPGCVKHIWMTWCGDDEHLPRKLVLRAWWDEEGGASVEAPLGDFFGVGHGRLVNFTSLPLTMSPEDGRGGNCFFPMPFELRARFEVLNEADHEAFLYFYVDYESYPDPEPVRDMGYFHAQWRRENPTGGWGDDRPRDWKWFESEAWKEGGIWRMPNLDGKDNYLILEAEGAGHYVGCNLNIDCFEQRKNVWYGEGDDMIWIDQDPGDWPPRLHGTGTEDYFNTAFCPKQTFSAPYHGVPLYSGTEAWPWKGKNSLYRFHIEDPVYFEKNIRVTLEHGHANNLANDYSSTAYWYQKDPHRPFPPLPDVKARMPRP